VAEVKAIVQDKTAIPGQTVSGQLDLTGILDSPSPTLHLELQLSWTAGEQPEEIGLIFSNKKGESYRITLKGDTFYADRSNAGETSFEEGFGRTATAPRWPDENKLDVEIWLDVASVEFFADSGATNLTEIFFPGEPFTQVTLEVEGGTIELESGEIGRVASIWQ
jgi:sucrose-6-phosphate hydrolase SacC (GH32 family)